MSVEKKLIALVFIALLVGLGGGYGLGYTVYQPQNQNLQEALDNLNDRIETINSTLADLQLRLRGIPVSYTVFISGGTYYAEANFFGGTEYSGRDAATVIQQAIDALTSGGKVLIKAGTYDIASRIELKTDIALEGEGPGTILKAASGLQNNNAMISDEAVPHDPEITYRCSVSNLYMDMNNVSTSVGIWFKRVYDGVIDHVTIKGFNNMVEGPPEPKGGALDIGSASRRGIISNCIADTCRSNDADFHITLVDTYQKHGGGVIKNCFSINPQCNAIRGEGHVVIEGNVVVGDANNTVKGIVLRGPCTVSENVITNVAASGAEAIRVAGDNVAEGSIVRGNIIYNAYTGIAVRQNESIVENNKIHLADNKAIHVINKVSRVQVKNNMIIDADRGIEVEGDNNEIHGNTVLDTRGTPAMDYGIRIPSGADNNRVFFNVVNGATTANITDGGSGTVIWGNDGFVTESSGTVTLQNGQTEVTVTHGCDYTPNDQDIDVHPIQTLNNASFWYVDTITATTFKIKVNADPGQNVNFKWSVRRI